MRRVWRASVLMGSPWGGDTEAIGTSHVTPAAAVLRCGGAGFHCHY